MQPLPSSLLQARSTRTRPSTPIGPPYMGWLLWRLALRQPSLFFAPVAFCFLSFFLSSETSWLGVDFVIIVVMSANTDAFVFLRL